MRAEHSEEVIRTCEATDCCFVGGQNYSAYMSNTPIVIRQGRAFWAPFGVEKSMTAQEIWNRRADDFTSPEGLKLESFGRLELSIADANLPSLQLIVIGEQGVSILPQNYLLPDDYVIHMNSWIPLRRDETSQISEFIRRENLRLNSPLSTNEYLKVLAAINSNVIPGNISIPARKFSADASTEGTLPALKVEPYDYQKTGIAWLTEMFNQGVGCILGDQMGLGKTLQLIALTIHASEKDRVLVVVPNSLKANWINEYSRFSPDLQPYVYAGVDRIWDRRKIHLSAIVLTTYDTLTRDIELFQSEEFGLIVCDEAHNLKNPKAMRRIAVASLKSEVKILATGTPVENELLDLWSLIDLIRPGLMGSKSHFQNLFDNDLSSARKIGDSVKPLILRRLTGDVLKELPETVIRDEVLESSAEFAFGYEEVRKGLIEKTENMPLVSKLQVLRMYCCYPPLVIPELGSIYDAKYERLTEILDEIYRNGEDKVIIFTSFRDSADCLKQFLEARYQGGFFPIVDGRIKSADERFSLINDFSSRVEFSVLIANPRVAGEGLNIVSANRVIHFNREWNPQKENQATARAMRPGQAKTVFVYRFYYENTIEEVIHHRLIAKSSLAGAALESTESEGGEKTVQEALLITPIFSSEEFRQNALYLNIRDFIED